MLVCVLALSQIELSFMASGVAQIPSQNPAPPNNNGTVNANLRVKLSLFLTNPPTILIMFVCCLGVIFIVGFRLIFLYRVSQFPATLDGAW